jgi:integrase
MGTHPKVVSDMLGHATVAITLDTYSHVTPGLGRQAAAAMDGLLGSGQLASESASSRVASGP